MTERLHGIVLERIRHNDRFDIVSIYSRERGRVPLVVAGGSSKNARMRRAMLMPLSIVEVTLNFKASTDLQRPSGLTPLSRFLSLYSDPYKQAVVFFIREFLSRLLRDYPADTELWHFIERSMDILNSLPHTRVANFHIVFLSRLTEFLGIRPDLSVYTRRDHPEFFDMRAGDYSDFQPLHRDVLKGAEATIPLMLFRLDYPTGARWPLSRSTRRELLEGLLRYYGLHFAGLDSLRAPDILRSLFD